MAQSSEILQAHKNPSQEHENLVPTQAEDSDPKLSSNHSSTLSFDHFLSHHQSLHIYNMKNQEECIPRGKYLVHFKGPHVTTMS